MTDLMGSAGPGERRGGAVGVFLSIATLLITVFGAGVAYLEYRDAQQRERVERVFRYSDRIMDEAEAVARVNTLSDAFILQWPAIHASAGANASREEIETAVGRWFAREIESRIEVRSAVDHITLFYDTLGVCVSEGMCDEKTAKALFAQQVSEFSSTFYPWVKFQSGRSYSAAGTQTICLSNRFCGGETSCPGLPASLIPCDDSAEPAAETPAQ